MVETIDGFYTVEVIHRGGSWHRFEAVEYVTLEWICWLNHRRLLEPNGNILPAEAEQCTSSTDRIRNREAPPSVNFP